ncbi:MAG: cyclic nucleotide-binding/CBS domain-containing protein [Candidatus Micrarchaeia archaeon]
MYSETRSLIVNEVMTFPVVTGSEKESIKSIAQKMKKHDISSVVIVDKSNTPVGMVTQGDIIKRLLSKKRNLLFAKAKDVMTSPAIKITKEMKLEDAAKYMVQKRVKRLCVVDDTNKLIGILTQEDVVKNASYLIDVLKEALVSGYTEESIGR